MIIQKSYVANQTRALLLAPMALALIITGCGGGDSSPPASPPASPPLSINLAAGGAVTLSSGAKLELMPGAGQGEIIFTGETKGAAGAVEADGIVISSEYEINAQGFAPGHVVAPFIVTLPIDTRLLPQTSILDRNGFVAQTRNESTGQWQSVKGFVDYDAATGKVRFQTGHLSSWRVKYIGPDVSTGTQQYTYYTDNFAIHYSLPMALGQTSRHFPIEDMVWNAKGSGIWTDPAAPNYVEDLGRALEQALTYYLGLSGSSGKLFSSPAILNHVNVYVTYLDQDSGDTSLPLGYIRIKAQLENWGELRTTAAHELMHLLQDQYYTKIGAWMNLWFFEASANLMSARATGMSRDEQLVYYTKEMANYLAVPLDASSQGSNYAEADFLNWLETRIGKPIVADVMQEDATWDLTALNKVLNTGTSTLGSLFSEYVLGATVGAYDLKPAHLWHNKMLTSVEPGWRYEFEQGHLSANAVEIRSNAEIDAMLVASSGRQYSQPRLQSYSYLGNIPHADLANPLEKTTASGQPVVVKHFGKAGTPGVTSSVFHQVIINPQVSDDTVWNSYIFDYYLLLPPRVEQLANGKVTWSYDGGRLPSSTNNPAIAGFNVYVDGVKLNSALVSAPLRDFSDTKIWVNSSVQVTVVDKYGNEWPEPKPPVAKPPFTAVTEVCASFSYYWETVLSRSGGGPTSVVQCIHVPSKATLSWFGNSFSLNAEGGYTASGDYSASGSTQTLSNVIASRPLTGDYATPPPPLKISFSSAPRDASGGIRYMLKDAAAEGHYTISYQPEDDTSGGLREARRVTNIVPNSVTVWLNASNF